MGNMTMTEIKLEPREGTFLHEIHKLRAENQRLRKALQNLLDVQSDQCWCHELEDGCRCEGCKARAALGEDDNEN